MKLFLILGNQLFPVSNFEEFRNDHIFFMAEDYELCSYEKHHKLKILLFLSSMRSHADQLKKKKFKLEYSKIDSNDYSGFAFGMGIERIVMLLYQIEDIRILYENDSRFLSQFKKSI